MKKICLGTVQFGLDYGIANTTGKPTLSDVENIIRYALLNNVSCFDTAQSYGDSEKVLGKVFKHLGCQQNVSIITKMHPDVELSDKTTVFHAIESSLKNLGMNQLWGLLLHRPSQLKNIDSFYKNIESLKREGLIKHFGVSIYTPEEALISLNNPITDIIQVPFNILDRRLIDIGFFDLAKSKNKMVFIRSVFLQGLLLMDKDKMSRKGMRWAIPYLNRLQDFLNGNNLKMNTFSLKAVTEYQKNAVIILGVDSKKQLEENLNMLSEELNYSELIDQWWKELPLYPDKLLNPSLW